MSGVAQFKYNGTAPGADTNVYTIFNSVTALNGARMAQSAGFHRLLVNIKHSQDGELNFYGSRDRGVTWSQYDASGSISAPASTSSTIRDYAIEEYPDFKVEWVNGGSAQATWVVLLSLAGERAALT